MMHLSKDPNLKQVCIEEIKSRDELQVVHKDGTHETITVDIVTMLGENVESMTVTTKLPSGDKQKQCANHMYTNCCITISSL